MYCNEWIGMVNNIINQLQLSKDLAEDYKMKLAAEEQLSHVNKRKK